MRPLLTTAVLTFCLLAISFGTAQAIGSEFLNYQGKLDSAGTPLNGNRDMTFRLYPTPAGGSLLWQEQTLNIPVSSGLFTHLLGSTNSLPDSVFNSNELWLEVEVEGQTISARSRLAAVAVSKRVASVDGASGGTITSKVSIGPGHINTGTDAFIAGSNNRARGNYSVVSGGGGATAADSNSANGDFSSVGGGRFNSAANYSATVSGGEGNHAGGFIGTVGGGASNTANNDMATVGGGWFNTASGVRSTVGGGFGDTASGNNATVCGGYDNFASGDYATIPGGFGNDALGYVSFAAGTYAKANHVGTFVWSDNTFTDFTTTAANQFLIRASGGVGIGTNSPAHPLHMASGAHVTAGGTWTNASSREYKTDIKSFNDEEYSEILKKLEDLDVVHFKYKSEPDVKHIGMIAEDVPDEIANKERNGIPTADAIAFLMAAVKAQQYQIEELKLTIQQLKDRHNEK